MASIAWHWRGVERMLTALRCVQRCVCLMHQLAQHRRCAVKINSTDTQHRYTAQISWPWSCKHPPGSAAADSHSAKQHDSPPTPNHHRVRSTLCAHKNSTCGIKADMHTSQCMRHRPVSTSPSPPSLRSTSSTPAAYISAHPRALACSASAGRCAIAPAVSCVYGKDTGSHCEADVLCRHGPQPHAAEPTNFELKTRCQA